jgi:hypothetical protein
VIHLRMSGHDECLLIAPSTLLHLSLALWLVDLGVAAQCTTEVSMIML